jgi:acetyl-CoA carboxylase biotin carboxyl carrier protein
MDLDRNDIAAIFAIIDSLDFVDLSIEVGGLKVTVSRATDRAATLPPATSAPPVVEPAVETVVEPSRPEIVPQPVDDGDLVVVEAPMLGTFYRCPKPGDPPYCEVGANVAAGDVIGLVEVMKMMNSVVAPVDGVVERILADDNALVEFEQALFTLRPTPVEEARP